VRASRQQDFLRQAKDQIGLGRLCGDRKELLRIFGRYTDTDLHSNTAILRLLKLAFESSGHPIREVRFRNNIEGDFVVASQQQLDVSKNEFLNVRASKGRREVGSSGSKKESAKARKRARRTSPGLPPGVINDRIGVENVVAETSTRVGFPVYVPRARLARGSYVTDGSPRAYDLYDGAHKRHRAYRIVVSAGFDGQYYGIQGTTWKSPPILDDPSSSVRMVGRTYMVFTDGGRIRLVAWRTPRAVYWVSNTLSETLTNKQMLAIARSLSRFGGK
jgi:hypothetical protein